MRVSELADVAGVSVRTIRHYHAIGLMPVPPRAGAWRDYGVDALPRRLAAVYDAIEKELEAIGSRRALTLLRRERRLSDIAVRLGHIGDDVVELLDHANPRDIAEYYLGIAALADPGWTEEQARALVVAAYPARGQRRFVEIAFERLATYIEEYTRG